ncbi:alpha/beta hydrolase [Sphingomonas sp. LB-2]|uniref:alpha/beta hydrolase n=1 Tax=Sphingomonas caeni TaxID=2984949 RepID=UPI002232823B|nr:alpha/beta hydrolase [Sphingomonas caeni]MCW3848586.1 alpha/beta hydrolase [Sphingomonas caeni]
MTATSAQHDYFDGQLRASHPALFERYAAASAAAVEEGASLDLRYGPHPRQTLDLFRSLTPPRATILYLHAGYWQSRDKSGFRFIAPPLTADGFDVALVNYPLCPEVGVAEIVAATLAGMPRIVVLLGDAPIVLAGHSAGAQIAVEIGMAARGQGWRVAGIVSISGVFDLVPLIGTSINDRLALDEQAARQASPLFRVAPDSPPALFAVGEEETAGFRAQTRRMGEAWAAAGNDARQIVVPGADHFSILGELGDGANPLGAAVRGFAP